MLNGFINDKARVSIKWLLQLVRGLTVRHILEIKHESTGVFHFLAILTDGRSLCDCCMQSNLGIPCRHYFRAWIDIKKLPFHLSFVRPRQDPNLAVESTPAVCRTHALGPHEFSVPTQTLRSAFASNPLDTTSHRTTPPPTTQTVPAREVFHEVQTVLRPLISGIQTREQVQELINGLSELQ
ncbi:hypothetical protein GGX14DRAFT_362350 [Mycena pura]|uniref:SWIM-type domain-containing protein n=1 Tax=Mycena pura TaxID=153505 RepID=A0AAD6VG65_9AGAR|nr:hypothetical protein GGX14DRAFT_362350 [Mycena pura]